MIVASHRSAEEIGRTAQGPRPLPPLGKTVKASQLASVDTVIANGLRVIVVRKPTVPMAELRLRIPFAGNDPRHAARAELLAQTLFTGTQRRSRTQIDTDLALVGGELGASAEPEMLRIGGSALANGLTTFLDVLADVLTSATYQDDEVNRERERLVEQITLAESEPSVIARKALQRHRYGDHPFAKEYPEANEVIETTVAEIRALHQTAVLPKGSVLVLVGDVDPDTTVATIANALAGWQSEENAKTLPALPVLRGGDLLLVHRPGAVQSQLRLSAQTLPRTDPRYSALQLANLVFGGFFSSRWVENIREDKGYTYSAHSYFEFTPGAATVLAEADTASDVSAAALWETRYELGRLGLVPPTASEVENARQYIIGALLTSTNSQAGLASQLATLAFAGLDADWLRSRPEQLLAVTNDQVAEVALEFFAPSAFTGVIVGDADVLSPKLRALGGVILP